MKCDLCNSNEIELLSETLRYSTASKIYRCKECGLVFLYPKMSLEEERAFYEKEYGDIYSTEKGTTPERLFETRLPDAKIYLDWVKDFIRNQDDCLEIGCASGYFLATLKPCVKSVAGIETHTLLKQFCESIGIQMFDQLDGIQDAQYDRIFLFFLLEHLGEPVEFLQLVRKKLKKDGTAFIVVPNVGDALLSLYDIPAFKSFYFTPAHQFYYSKETLALLFKKAGFERFDIYPIQRYDLSNHMHWMMYGRPGGMGRYNQVFSETLLKEYSRVLEDRFICDTLFAVVSNTE